MKELHRHGGSLLLALLIVILDQWSKWIIELHLALHSRHAVVSTAGWADWLPLSFDLVHVRNTGVAFGLFADLGASGPWLLALLAGSALAALVVYYLYLPADAHLLRGSLALVLGGAVGNLIDRILGGAVTDFLDIYLRLSSSTHHWPAFNVADSAITVGVLLMVIGSLRYAPTTSAPAGDDAGSPP